MNSYKNERVGESVLERASKRSLALTFIGLFFVFQGMRVLGTEPSNANLAILYEVIPRDTRATLWIALGTITALWAWVKSRQWAAVAAAVVMPVERIVSYLWSGVHYYIPGPPEGFFWSWIDVMRWASVLCLIIVIAGWTEYDKRGTNND